MKKLSLLLVALLYGCSFAPVGELRQLPPTRSAMFAKDYEELGSCVAEGMQAGESNGWSAKAGDMTYEVIHRKSASTMFVTARFPDRGFVMLDASFIKQDDKTLVETRQGRMNGELVRGPRLIEEDAWPIIEKCAE